MKKPECDLRPLIFSHDAIKSISKVHVVPLLPILIISPELWLKLDTSHLNSSNSLLMILLPLDSFHSIFHIALNLTWLDFSLSKILSFPSPVGWRPHSFLTRQSFLAISPQVPWALASPYKLQDLEYTGSYVFLYAVYSGILLSTFVFLHICFKTHVCYHFFGETSRL